MSQEKFEPFETFDHTADVGIIARGRTRRELFANAARGMFSIITDISKVRGAIQLPVRIEAEGAEELLVSWLRELLYLFSTRYLVCTDFKFNDLSDTGLDCEAGSGPLEKPDSMLTEIKAVTYHGLEVKHENDLWTAKVLFDI